MKFKNSVRIMEFHKMTALYFLIGCMKMLNVLNEEVKNYSIDFVINNCVVKGEQISGFRGGPFAGFSSFKNRLDDNVADMPHSASTYCALSIIRMCEIEMKSFKRMLEKRFNLEENVLKFDGIINEIKKCNIDGEFRPQNWDCEHDLRYTYTSIAILKLLELNPNDYLDSYRIMEKINQYKSYEGGYSMEINGESNGIISIHLAGLTYCAISSIIMMNKEVDNPHLIKWLINRQTALGYNGRTNKGPDTCYSYWALSTLSILGHFDLVDVDSTVDFLLTCQTKKATSLK